MSWPLILGAMVGGIAVLMAMGFPVAFAFLTANVIGALFFFGGVSGISQVLINAKSAIAIFTFIPIPLFILMGELFFRTGLAARVFDALDKVLGKLPGRLCYLTVTGGTLFSALSGSSMANTAMLGSLMLPEMQRRGYKSYMAMGPILGTGGLAMIIPPSGLAVLLGSLAQIDIAALLIAGLIPGVVLATLYVSMITLQIKLDPEATPAYEVAHVSLREKIMAVLINVVPMTFVMFCVIGTILLGWATPSEAAAFGVASVLILTALFRCLSWKSFLGAVRGSLRVTAMVFFIIMGSSTFSQILAYSGATSGLVEWVTSIQAEPTVFLLMMFGIILVLGTLIDASSILMLTIPVFIPLAQALNFDLVWFGLILLMGIEMSGTTPPFGMLLFVMLGVAPRGTTLWQAARAAAPFLICDLILISLLIIFPSLALFLPRLIDS